MYSNDRGFGLKDLIIKIIFLGLFVLLMVWLFPKVPNMKPFYSNVFRENISYMQDASKSYFTTDKLPTKVGESVKLTLKEMQEMKLILPFVDKDGNSCNIYESYSEVTKEENGYKLKVNLNCNTESDYIVEVLGCYDYGCGSCNVEEKEKETAIEYQFTKNFSKEITNWTCPSGYKRDGKYCYKTVVNETIAANKKYSDSRIEITNSKVTDGKQQKILLNTIKTVIEDSKVKTPVPYEISFTAGSVTLVPLTVIKGTTGGNSYDCSTTENKCTTTNVTKTYDCECYKKKVNGVYTTVCNTCSSSVPVTTCKDVTVSKTCTGSTQTTYTCPEGTTKKVGSGLSLQCFKEVKTGDSISYKCPSDVDGYTGSGTSLQCYKLTTVKGSTKYGCPTEADVSEGTGENLKCYKYTNGEEERYCEDTEATLDPITHKCKKEVSGKFEGYSCPSKDYDLKGDACVKSTTDKVKAESSTYTKTWTETKWSRNKTLWGWTATGKTRIVEL